jgi:hypothetical protein
VGNIRQQIKCAKELTFRFDVAQEICALSNLEALTSLGSTYKSKVSRTSEDGSGTSCSLALATPHFTKPWANFPIKVSRRVASLVHATSKIIIGDGSHPSSGRTAGALGNLLKSWLRQFVLQ